MTTADVNHDGRADLIVANQGGDTVSVLLGTPTIAATSVTATSPEPPGTALGIGDILPFVVATDLSVDSVTGGTPTLSLSNGATATFTGFDADGLHFSYTVQAGQDTADLVATGLDLNGATVDHAASFGLCRADHLRGRRRTALGDDGGREPRWPRRSHHGERLATRCRCCWATVTARSARRPPSRSAMVRTR